MIYGEDPRPLSLLVVEICLNITYYFYLKGDNSYKMSSEPFNQSVPKLRKDIGHILVKVWYCYLFWFRRSSRHKLFSKRGDNSVKKKGAVSQGELRKRNG